MPSIGYLLVTLSNIQSEVPVILVVDLCERMLYQPVFAASLETYRITALRFSTSKAKPLGELWLLLSGVPLSPLQMKFHDARVT